MFPHKSHILSPCSWPLCIRKRERERLLVLSWLVSLIDFSPGVRRYEVIVGCELQRGVMIDQSMIYPFIAVLIITIEWHSVLLVPRVRLIGCQLERCVWVIVESFPLIRAPITTPISSPFFLNFFSSHFYHFPCDVWFAVIIVAKQTVLRAWTSLECGYNRVSLKDYCLCIIHMPANCCLFRGIKWIWWSI